MAKDICVDIAALLQRGGFDVENVKIGVAVSGGRDSVALLHILKEGGANIVAINVEHGIRGQASLDDTAFVAELCKNWDIPLIKYAVDVPAFCDENGYTLEQGARILRYRAFDGAIADGKCDIIALAHHLDDQTETVLMRLLRGSGTRGLVGMRQISGRYIRPLLYYDREDINLYIQKHGLSYVDDASNADIAYTRNFLREEIARLKQRYPRLNDAILRLCNSVAEQEELLDGITPKPVIAYGDDCCEAFLPIDKSTPVALVKRGIHDSACAVGVYQDIEDRHYQLILDLISASNGKKLSLPHGLVVYRENGGLLFERLADNGGATIGESGEIKFAEGVFEKLGVSVKRLEVDAVRANLKSDDKSALYIDASKTPANAVLRRRKNGDFIEKFGGGTKSLGDFLTDKKIPARLRDRLTVLASGSEILAVFGVEISKKCMITPSTQRVFELATLSDKFKAYN